MAACLHDWHKKHETLKQKQLIKAGQFTLEAFLDILNIEENFLKGFGFYSDKVIELTGATLPKVDKSCNLISPVTIQQKIIWFVDAMLTGIEINEIDKRFNNLEAGIYYGIADPKKAERNCAFSNLFKPWYGMSLYDMQRKLAITISKEFCDLTGFISEPENLPIYLKKAVFIRLNS